MRSRITIISLCSLGLMLASCLKRKAENSDVKVGPGGSSVTTFETRLNPSNLPKGVVFEFKVTGEMPTGSTGEATFESKVVDNGSYEGNKGDRPTKGKVYNLGAGKYRGIFSTANSGYVAVDLHSGIAETGKPGVLEPKVRAVGVYYDGLDSARGKTAKGMEVRLEGARAFSTMSSAIDAVRTSLRSLANGRARLLPEARSSTLDLTRDIKNLDTAGRRGGSTRGVGTPAVEPVKPPSRPAPIETRPPSRPGGGAGGR